MVGPAPTNEGGYLVVATIRKPHGVRGELSLALETDRPNAVFRKGRQLIVGDQRGRPVGSTLTVERVRTIPGGLLLKASEFTGRTAELEALRGRSLLIATTDAAPAGADESHYRDLLGVEVFVGETSLGVVRAITETAAGELLVIPRPGGELLIPFVREWIREEDAERKRLVIEPPEGLLEL